MPSAFFGRRRAWKTHAAITGFTTFSITATGLAATPAPFGFDAPESGYAAISRAAYERFAFAYDSVLGTSLDLVVCSASQSQALACERSVLAEIERLRGILSTYDPSSEISRVKMGGAVESSELAELLAAYGIWNNRTGGAIDVNMAEVIRLWKSGERPDDAALLDAYRKPLSLNVDALGKGYIIDRAVEIARQIAPAGLLNIGGDIRAWGDVDWTIGVADPRDSAENGALIAQFNLRESAVATSGDYARFSSIKGTRYSHIIDPRTLAPTAENVNSATVIAKDCVSANALSTAASILGTKAGVILAQTFGAAGFLLVEPNNVERGGALAAPIAANLPAKKLDTNSPAAQQWPKDFQVSVEIALKGPPAPAATAATAAQAPATTRPVTAGRRGGGAFKRPYVAIWVQNTEQKVIRTVTVWGNQPKWVPELSYWWNSPGADQNDVATITKATRPPGKYTIAWDGKDDKGNAVPPGEYTIYVEINREHGRHARESVVLKCGDAPTSAMLKATVESDESKVEYGPRAN